MARHEGGPDRAGGNMACLRRVVRRRRVLRRHLVLSRILRVPCVRRVWVWRLVHSGPVLRGWIVGCLQ